MFGSTSNWTSVPSPDRIIPIYTPFQNLG